MIDLAGVSGPLDGGSPPDARPRVGKGGAKGAAEPFARALDAARQEGGGEAPAIGAAAAGAPLRSAAKAAGPHAPAPARSPGRTGGAARPQDDEAEPPERGRKAGRVAERPSAAPAADGSGGACELSAAQAGACVAAGTAPRPAAHRRASSTSAEGDGASVASCAPPVKIAGAPRPDPSARRAAAAGARTPPAERAPAPPRTSFGEAVARAARDRLEKEPERAAHGAETKRPAPQPAGQLSPVPAHAAPASPATSGPADPKTLPPSAAAAALPRDPAGDVAGAILPASAHLRVSTDVLGEVTLHLRVREGAAHVRVEVPAAAAVEAQRPELARALAAEGLTLAKLDVETRAPAPVATPAAEGGLAADPDGGRQQRHDAPPRDEPPSPPRPAPLPRPRRRGGHDVTA